MSCATDLCPKIVGISKAMSAGGKAAKDLIAQLCQPCANGKGEPSDNAKRMVDNAVICDVMCCCKSAEYKQVCVDQTFSAADAKLGYKSRYKSEISYNMSVKPPSPFMHRDKEERDTTQRSTYWQGRARDDIEYYHPGVGYVRRPDIVIVENPSIPPYQSNIERVVELKFDNDRERPGQYTDYTSIAGERSKFKVIHNDDCDCSDRRRRRAPEPVPVAVPQKKEEPARSTGMSILGTAAAVGIVVLGAAALAVAAPAAAGTATAAALGLAWMNIFGNAPAGPPAGEA